jgi:hypothetical protein
MRDVGVPVQCNLSNATVRVSLPPRTVFSSYSCYQLRKDDCYKEKHDCSSVWGSDRSGKYRAVTVFQFILRHVQSSRYLAGRSGEEFYATRHEKISYYP